VRVVVPFAAGGPADLVARLLCAELAAIIGQSCVVENVTGAGGAVGTDAMLRAAADGHTLLLGSSSTLVLNPLLQPGRNEPMTALVPIRQLAQMPLVCVTAPGGLVTLTELVARIQAAPGQVAYGSAGVGSISHLVGALLLREARVEAIHVPYRGSAPAVQAALSGEVLFFLDALSGVRAQVADGTLRGLVVTAAKRSRFLPEVPAAPEAGMSNLVTSTWYGLLAPRATPQPVVEALAAATGRAAVKLAGTPQSAASGLEVLLEAGPEHFAETIRTERSSWAPIVAALGLAP
jgi:tripartite-type tricarboxylate transporter receptor subunit TctC